MAAGSPVLDHVALLVSDMEASRRFYLAALASLGFPLLYESDACVAFGTQGHDDFAICLEQPPTTRAHIAFVATDRAAVDAFHAAAVAAGGRDNGAPALRPEYHPGYYGAFVLDPDGNNVEAVHHTR
jgi:catechol 2,3-dioxygenase-like lactoylglutathione lyase family enzyme